MIPQRGGQNSCPNGPLCTGGPGITPDRALRVYVFLGGRAPPKSHPPLSQKLVVWGPPDCLALHLSRVSADPGRVLPGPRLCPCHLHWALSTCSVYEPALGVEGDRAQGAGPLPSSPVPQPFQRGRRREESPVSSLAASGPAVAPVLTVPLPKGPFPLLGRASPGGSGAERGAGVGGSPRRGSANGKGGRAGCVGGEGGAAGARRAGGGREAGAGARGARAALTLPRPGRAAGAARAAGAGAAVGAAGGSREPGARRSGGRNPARGRGGAGPAARLGPADRCAGGRAARAQAAPGPARGSEAAPSGDPAPATQSRPRPCSAWPRGAGATAGPGYPKPVLGRAGPGWVGARPARPWAQDAGAEGPRRAAEHLPGHHHPQV